MSRWKHFRYRLERLGIDALAWGIPRLSRQRCVRLGNTLGSLAYLLDARGRAVALANLECAFGSQFTDTQRRAMARASYRNFVRTMLDLFWAENLTPENWKVWLKLEGFEELHARHAQNAGGSILFCIHQGNWEWASLAFGFMGFPTIIVAENFKNPLLTTAFSRMREHSGHTIIPQESSILRLLKTVKRGGSAGMLIDLSLRPNKTATVIEAFGMKMCVPLLHSVLADRANALLVPVETQPQPDGTCRVIAHPRVEIPPGASLQEIAQCCWDAFAPTLRARPEAWLWPYKHFRYKPNAATHEYPFYAHQSGKFEKLLRTVLPPSPARPGEKHSTEF